MLFIKRDFAYVLIERDVISTTYTIYIYNVNNIYNIYNIYICMYLFVCMYIYMYVTEYQHVHDLMKFQGDFLTQDTIENVIYAICYL